MNLYLLTDEFEQAAIALNEMVEAGEIDEEAMADTLEGLAGDIEEKSISLACYVKNIDALSGAIREEEKRMAERRRSYEKHSDRLKNYLLENLKRCDLKAVESPLFKISIRKNPPSVVVTGDVPGEFVKVKVSVYVTRKA